jgi:hypothetical protein
MTEFFDEEAVLNVRLKCQSLIDTADYALRCPLTSQDDDGDSPEARDGLTRALCAARSLMSHLTSSYDFGDSALGAFARPKEGVCLE